jgi:REP element-mobilizing transposase RayT
MTAPRQILKNTTYLITRRCSQRQFLIRPDKEGVINNVFLFCLAYAADQYGVVIHAFCALSNHYHAVITDRDGNLPDFMASLNKLVSKCVNDHLDRGETLWSSNPYSAVKLADENAILEKIVYTLTNPIAAGLVPHLSQWPGSKSDPEGYGKTTIITRPKVFFRDKGDVPKQVELELVVPPNLVDHTNESFSEAVSTLLKAKEKELNKQFKQEGRRFMGAKRVMTQCPYATPTSKPKERGISPRVATRDKGLREQADQEDEDFKDQYDACWKAYKHGNKNVVWPAGTWWMVRRAKCLSFPQGEFRPPSS